MCELCLFFFSSRRRHTRFDCDWSSDVCSSDLLNAPIDDEGAFEIARRSRGTPRIANRLLRRVRDYADVRGDGSITRELADRALAMLDVDPQGDRKSTRLNSSHSQISYAVFCLKKKKQEKIQVA